MKDQLRYRAAGVLLFALLCLAGLPGGVILHWLTSGRGWVHFALCVLAAPALAVLLSCFVSPLAIAKAALRAFDVGIGAALFKAPGCTLSAWSWKRRGQGWARFVIWLTDLIQPGHCQAAWERERPVFKELADA